MMLDLEAMAPKREPRPTINLQRDSDTRRNEISDELDPEHQELVAALQKELGLTA